MEKKTLKFQSLGSLAGFSKLVSTGFIMNTNNFTLTGRFSDEEINTAQAMYQAILIETSEKVFTYEF